MTTEVIRIERAEKFHLPAIVDIYNEAIAGKFATADRTPFTVEEKMHWFTKHDEGHPLYVATENNDVTGWYSLSSYREGREALTGVRELSYYVRGTQRQKGTGTLLVSHAIETARRMSIEHLIAIVLEKNGGSIRLLEKCGFVQWGHLPGVANFDGERCGHLYYGLKLI